MALAIDQYPELEREPGVDALAFLVQLGDPLLGFAQLVAVVASEFDAPAGPLPTATPGRLEIPPTRYVRYAGQAR